MTGPDSAAHDEFAGASRRWRRPPASGQGPPTVPATLEAAGALRADVLVAATTSDETNLVVALLAKQHFAIARVIGRVNDAANEELFDASWGVDALVSPSTAIVSMVRPPP